jgi:hypothetical protein
MNISLDEIRKALDVAFRDLEAMGINQVKLKEDYYWHVPVNDMFGDKPFELGSGQLWDDAFELKRMAAENEGNSASLVFFGGILNYLSVRLEDFLNTPTAQP